jgi:hypothetical protein
VKMCDVKNGETTVCVVENGETSDVESWDELLVLEERMYRSGYEEGIQQAIAKERHEGASVAATNAYNVGREMGRWFGMCLVWAKWLQSPNCPYYGDERRIAAVRNLQILLHSFPTTNENERLASHVKKTRAKYKQVASLLSYSNTLTKQDLSF